MNSADVIKQTYGFSQMVLQGYLGDLTDADLLETPGEGCNPIAWQLGHLICSEGDLLEMVAAGGSIELPDGFVQNHSRENTSPTETANLLSRAEYLELFQKTQAATFAALDALSEQDLDQPGPESMREFCPTVGALFVLIATHVMMHVGQIVPVRRRLGKPVVM